MIDPITIASAAALAIGAVGASSTGISLKNDKKINKRLDEQAEKIDMIDSVQDSLEKSVASNSLITIAIGGTFAVVSGIFAMLHNKEQQQINELQQIKADRNDVDQIRNMFMNYMSQKRF